MYIRDVQRINFQYILNSLISVILINCHSALKSITTESTHKLSPPTKHLLYRYKESIHSRTYESYSIYLQIT